MDPVGVVARVSVKALGRHELSSTASPLCSQVWFLQGNSVSTRRIKKISAPSYEINYATKLDDSHFDVTNDGKADWKDYKSGIGSIYKKPNMHIQPASRLMFRDKYRTCS
jgi:hypothetical protein